MTEQILEKSYISPARRRKLDIREEVKKVQSETDSNANFINRNNLDSFYTLCENAKAYIYQLYDSKIDETAKDRSDENFIAIFHNAVTGVPESMNLIKSYIDDFIKINALKNLEYPKYYESLVEAVYEETFGWGPLSVFKRMPQAEGAQVLGTQIKVKTENGWSLLPFQFRFSEQVKDLCNRFANVDPKNILNNNTNPELETYTYDGYRVSIMIPDRMYKEHVITLRRSTISTISIEKLAELNTFPFEAIPIFKSLAKFQASSVVAGPPGCGKSTLLFALLGEALYEVKDGEKIPERFNTLYAETSPEFDPRAMFPNSNVLHVVGTGDDFEKNIPKSALRHDISRVVLGEIRENETGLYRRASLQGLKQVMGTLHDNDPLDIPEIMTNLYLQYFNQNYNHEHVYKSFVKNLHFSISMDEFLMEVDNTEKLVKKVTGIQFYDYHPQSSEVHMYRIMHYDEQTNKWTFSNQVPKRFERIVKKYSKKSLELFTETLNNLAKLYPMAAELQLETGYYARESI